MDLVVWSFLIWAFMWTLNACKLRRIRFPRTWSCVPSPLWILRSCRLSISPPQPTLIFNLGPHMVQACSPSTLWCHFYHSEAPALQSTRILSNISDNLACAMQNTACSTRFWCNLYNIMECAVQHTRILWNLTQSIVFVIFWGGYRYRLQPKSFVFLYF